jgi:integrase
LSEQSVSDITRGYLAAAHSAATRRAYRIGFAHFVAWCEQHARPHSPSSPETVADYLSAHAAEYAAKTLRQRVAAIGYGCWQNGHEIDTRSRHIQAALLGIAKAKNQPQRQSAAFTADDIKAMLYATDPDTRGVRDRALLLIGFSGAFRRSELVGINIAHVAATQTGIRIHVPRSKEDQVGRGAMVDIGFGQDAPTCPVAALRAWLTLVKDETGPVFRRISVGQTIAKTRLHAGAVDRIVKRLAGAAGIVVPDGEILSPHGLRAGLITAAYKAGIGDEEIRAHLRHKDIRSMRGYVRRARLDKPDMTKAIGL